MTGSDSAKVPAQDQSLGLGGKQAKDLVSADTAILADGSVTGTLYHVSDFEAFNPGNLVEQSGNYFPMHLDDEKYGGKAITVKRGDAGSGKTANELDWILRVPSKETTFTFSEGGKDFLTLNFTKANLQGA